MPLKKFIPLFFLFTSFEARSQENVNVKSIEGCWTLVEYQTKDSINLKRPSCGFTVIFYDSIKDQDTVDKSKQLNISSKEKEWIKKTNKEKFKYPYLLEGHTCHNVQNGHYNIDESGRINALFTSTTLTYCPKKCSDKTDEIRKYFFARNQIQFKDDKLILISESAQLNFKRCDRE